MYSYYLFFYNKLNWVGTHEAEKRQFIGRVSDILSRNSVQSSPVWLETFIIATQVCKCFLMDRTKIFGLPKIGSSDRGSGYRPYQKLGGPSSKVAISTAMPFFACLVKCFSATLGCSDEISIVATELIRRDIHCANKTYFEPCIEIRLGKKVTKFQTWRF